MKNRLPFSTKNVIRSLSEITSLPPIRLTVLEKKIGPSSKLCTVRVGGLGEDQKFFDDLTIYRDQRSLDACCAMDIQYDGYGGFYQTLPLSDEEIVRCVAKDCNLRNLNHWIISEGRDRNLSKNEIEAGLKRPLEFLLKNDVEGALSILVSQCLVDDVSKSLLSGAGGAQKVWKDELFEVLSGGFILHLIEAREIRLFKSLAKTSKRSQRTT